uniref:Glycosyltransferase n=1 Tax=Ignisphaera aggregans TaxID=334771 RepID=A0A7J3YUK4_9CREN
MTRDDLLLECRKGVKYCLGVASLWWLPRLAREWIKQVDRVVCVSKRQAEIVADQIPELKDKIKVIYNPTLPEILNIEPRKEPDDTPTFLYVGGDSYVKGFHILLRALKEIGKQGVKAKFILTNFYSRRSLKVLKALNVKYENLEIDVKGRVKYEELLNLHREAWGLVFPSIWEEPLPYAIIQSALMGTIPIAMNVGGVPEILSKTPAEEFLIKDFSPISLAKKLQVLTMLGKAEIMKIGSALSRRVRKLNNSSKIATLMLE